MMQKIINTVVILLCILIVILALFGNSFVPHDPNMIDLMNKFAPFSADHLLGTDHLGRDQLSRLIAGATVSLQSVFLTLLLILVIGVGVGGFSGFIGGKIDFIIMRICDVFLSFPTVVLALFLVGILGAGLTNVIIAIAFTHWAWYARIVRSIVLSIKTREYILISTACGATFLQNFRKNMLRPISSQCLVLATLDIGHIMLHVSGLSFLGLGVKSPTAEWGIMISDAKDYIFTNSSLIIYPGAAIFITVLAFNLLGDMLRDKLDFKVEIDELAHA